MEILHHYIADAAHKEDKLNKTREFLQLLILKILFDKGFFSSLAFVGGTALRLLYDSRRFSEDLDFSATQRSHYTFGSLLDKLTGELQSYGFHVTSVPERKRTVQSSFIKFHGLMKSLGLGPFENQAVSVKIEIDTHPPIGWHTAVTPMTRLFVFAVTHYDLPSLFAAKLHACFCRRYTKGRDFYDLVWYLGKKIKPNYTLLNNAMQQTGGEDLSLNSRTIVDFMLTKIDALDFSIIRKDVSRFLQDKNELQLLHKPLIKEMIKSHIFATD